MMEGWKEVKLKNLCKAIQYGYTESANSEQVGPKFLRITDIVNEIINWETVPFCPISKENFEKYKLEIGDIVVARTGNTTGYAKLIRNTKEVVFASYLIRFKIDNTLAESGFIGRLIESSLFKNYVWSIIGGSAQPVANAKLLGSFPINLPPLKTQQKIASILSAYDDLIENNLKRIKLLEEQAQQTYEEWFVRFKFPGYENVEIDPSTSSGQVEVSGLPVGWERKRLDKLIILQRGFDLPSRLREDGKVPIYASTGITDYHNEFKVKGPGVITGRSGTLGQVQYSPGDFWPLNTALWVKKYINCGPIYVLHFLRSLNLESFGGGSAVPSLDRKVVHSQKINIPNLQLLKDFENYCHPHFKIIDNLILQNQLLKEARDILLPRLMSGMIDVESLGVNEELGMVVEEKVKYN